MSHTQVAQSPPLDEVADGRAPSWLRGIFMANLVAQVGIVVTGGIVRLTGSGLGCPTWPDCVDGSVLPTERQAESWHKYVEFGNRLLTFVLVALAIAAVVGVWRWTVQRRRAGLTARRPIIWLALAPILGTVAQAVLGGITVLTGLHPAIVAAHFLLSMVIIAAVTVLVTRANEPGDRPSRVAVPPAVRVLSALLVGVGALVVVLGTIVTGAGPNSGDADVATRFGIDQRVAAWLHADAVLLFVGLVVGLLVAVTVANVGTSSIRGRSIHLLGVTVVNGAVGYTQLFTGLPWALVATHMLLACLVWIAVIRVCLATSTRGVAPELDLSTPAT